MKEGAVRVVTKPFEDEDLALSIRSAASQRQKVKLLNSLTEISYLMNTSLDPVEVLNRTCEAAVKLFGVDHSGLVQFSEDGSSGWTIAEHPILASIDTTLGTAIPVRAFQRKSASS